MLIPFKDLFPKYNINPTGILHVGASEGQEAQRYDDLGVKNVTWIEAIPWVYENLKRNTQRFPGHVCINACIGDEDGKEVYFNISSNEGQSSSYLDFGTHSREHPSVIWVDKLKMKTTRLDTLLNELKLMDHPDVAAPDFLVMDLQGAELFALRGLGDLLHKFKWAYLEINAQELYRGCALIGEVQEYLQKYGFVFHEFHWTDHGWGDGLAIKGNIV